jgi:hypothetical protein
MTALIGRCQMAIRRFSGFPATSLPRLRFYWKVAYKILIQNDFLAQTSLEKIFSLSFPERQGKGGGGATQRTP